MKTILLHLLLAVFALTSDAETIVLKGREYPNVTKKEGIMIWVRDNRSLLADSGPTTVAKLIQTCKEWRKKGTEPGIRIVLYPILPANKDLGAILELINQLDKNKVSFEIWVSPADDVAPQDLFVTKK